MQREIKFRAWDTYNKRMIHGPYRFEPADPLAMKAVNTEEWQRAPWVFYESSTDIEDGIDRPCFIMQFTGLKDRAGNEIYEGDLLRVCNGSINGVEWMEKPYEVKYVLNKGYDICLFCWDKEGNSRMDSTHWCEVVGNVFENSQPLTP